MQAPAYTIIDQPTDASLQVESYLATDPALVIMYKQLRDKTVQTLKGASTISPRTEWEFVTQIARIYDRMGCDILALDLGRPFPHTSSITRSSLILAQFGIGAS